MNSPMDPRRQTAFLSYDRIESWLHSLVPQLRDEGFALIVGILRGGSFPAVVLSHEIGAPVAFMRFDRASGIASWDSLGQPLPPPGTRVLLVEDVAGMGETLVRCRALLEAAGLAVKVLTVVHDSLSRSRPDWSMDFTGRRAIFPWERFAVSPAWAAAFDATADNLGDYPPDHSFEFWGFDLDGVFIPDMPMETYLPDPEPGRDLRDTHGAVLPALAIPAGSVIVTGRSYVEEARTLAWLAREGIAMAVHFRDEAVYAFSSARIANYKADRVRDLGLTHYVESELSQAVAIAAANPHVRVAHYDLPTQRLTWISAQTASQD